MSKQTTMDTQGTHQQLRFLKRLVQKIETRVGNKGSVQNCKNSVRNSKALSELRPVRRAKDNEKSLKVFKAW